MRKQKSPSAFGFDRYDKRRLERAMQSISDKRTFLRLKAVVLTAQGMNVRAVAKLLDKTPRAIYYWVRAYLANHSPKDLLDAPRSGRPAAVPEITGKQILLELNRTPLHLGYNTTVWTVALLAQHLNLRYNAGIAPRTLRRRMKQMGLRFKRPRYVYSEKDPNRTQKKGQSSGS